MAWIRIVGSLSLLMGTAGFLWRRHQQNEQNRDQVIEHDGHDVEVDAAPYLRRDGTADRDPDVDGDEYDVGAQVVHDNWVDGTEPRA